jgi:hypothetical protein
MEISYEKSLKRGIKVESIVKKTKEQSRSYNFSNLKYYLINNCLILIKKNRVSN